MTLLREIQTEVANADSDLAAVLRKCKILAVRLSGMELGKWVAWELNGYPDGSELPPYQRRRRRPASSSKGLHFAGPVALQEPPTWTYGWRTFHFSRRSSPLARSGTKKVSASSARC